MGDFRGAVGGETLPPLDLAGVEMWHEIGRTLNRHSAENGSNTPDFVLARFLRGCLATFDSAVEARDRYQGLREELDDAHAEIKRLRGEDVTPSTVVGTLAGMEGERDNARAHAEEMTRQHDAVRDVADALTVERDAATLRAAQLATDYAVCATRLRDAQEQLASAWLVVAERDSEIIRLSDERAGWLEQLKALGWLDPVEAARLRAEVSELAWAREAAKTKLANALAENARLRVDRDEARAELVDLGELTERHATIPASSVPASPPAPWVPPAVAFSVVGEPLATGHLRARVFAGPGQEHMAVVGELTLSHGEYAELDRAFRLHSVGPHRVFDAARRVVDAVEELRGRWPTATKGERRNLRDCLTWLADLLAEELDRLGERWPAPPQSGAGE